MKRYFRALWRAVCGRPPSIYILVAMDADHRVGECVVVSTLPQAQVIRRALVLDWGGANIAESAARFADLNP